MKHRIVTTPAALALLALVLMSNGAAAQAPDDPISAEAMAAFERIKPEAMRTLGVLGGSIEGNHLAWNVSHILNAYVLMYEATGDAKYLDALPSYADRIFYNRADRWGIPDELRGRVVKGWTSRRYQTGDKTFCWMGHAAATVLPIVRWSYYVKKDPQLAAKYGEKADAYVRQAAETILDFDTDWRQGPGADEGHYLGLYDEKYASSPHKPGGIQDEPLPYNYHSLAGRLFVWLYLATGDERFERRAAMIARFEKNRMRVEGDTYAWAYAAYRHDKAYEDTGHASLTMSFPLEAFKAGIVFDEADVRRIVNRFLAWCPEGLEKMPTYMDGSGDTGKDHNMTRWAILARHDERVRQRAYDYMKARWDVKHGTQFRYLEGAAHLLAAANPPQRYEVLPPLARVEINPSSLFTTNQPRETTHGPSTQ